MIVIVSEDGTWNAMRDGFDVTGSLAGVVSISDLADVREGYMVDTAEIDLRAKGQARQYGQLRTLCVW